MCENVREGIQYIDWYSISTKKQGLHRTMDYIPLVQSPCSVVFGTLDYEQNGHCP